MVTRHKKVPEDDRQPGKWMVVRLLLVLLLVYWQPVAALEEGTRPAPEGATSRSPVEQAVGRTFMVVTAHPLASEAAALALRVGGSAVDAAIAAQLVLTLVEPQSSGIGGGALMLHFDGRTVRAFDGRETAPKAAREGMFLNADGTPVAFMEAVVGGRSVGVPGVLRLLEMVHRRFGRLPWADLFLPAIRLAEEGFPVSPRLHALLARERHLPGDAAARAYFYRHDGSPWPVGTVLKNPALAAVLRQLADHGADAFYTGPLARELVARVQAHGGLLAERDLEDYWALARDPICVRHRGDRVCGFPPPSSGGIAVAQMLGILERKGIANFRPGAGRGGLPPAGAIHLFAEAGRLAFADRGSFIADPGFVRVPAGLLDDSYLDGRARQIGSHSFGQADPGRPAGAGEPGAEGSDERPATSHLSIVDPQGQAVAMTSSIESGFGARLMVHGFLLNNQLTDFSFLPSVAGRMVANRVGPGKRPRSSMAPTMVVGSDGHLRVILGSPGGPWIINYVAKTLVALLDWGLDLKDAVDMANFGSRNGPTELETGHADPGLVGELRHLGHVVVEADMSSGVAAVVRTPAGWVGVADPRREGKALGE